MITSPLNDVLKDQKYSWYDYAVVFSIYEIQEANFTLDEQGTVRVN